MLSAVASILSTFLVSAPPAVQPIHGVWVTNVASPSMNSPEEVRKTLEICKQNGVNAVFVVVWNSGMTTYPSEVLNKYIGVKQDPRYKGFDPLAEFIRQGKDAGIAVHAWFEYGFSYRYGTSPNRWSEKYPQWVGKDREGKPLSKNGFAWWNALDPGPQELIKELYLEVVKKYDVVGVQGDDRLPAMPSEGGYDELTLAAFRKETGTQGTPRPKDRKWVQWRSDRLSAFGKDLYTAVKKVRPDCLVSWAPSVYPWSMQEYLQDWPAWLRGGYADFVMPQVYRYSYNDYEQTLKQLRSQVSDADIKRVFPGLLTALGDGYRMDEELLQQKRKLNTKMGFEGECLFYFESLRKKD